MNSDRSGLQVALIGGAGFIGHHLALKLAASGARVKVIDSMHVNNLVHFSTTQPELRNRNLYLKIIHERLDLLHQRGIELHPVDARDYHALGHTLDAGGKPDVIIQLAAVAHAGQSNKNPFNTFDHSLRTLENALDMARGNAKHFIFVSSSMVYGNFRTEAVAEDHPLEPLGIYGALKVSGEKIVIAYQQVFGLPYTIIRPSALYGPRCVSRRVVQIFIESALAGDPLKVIGDGSERLDFTFVEDLVDGICLAVDNPAAYNQVFNMTYGQSRSIAELAKITQEHFPDAVMESVERDQLTPVRGTLQVDRARELLGYSPRFPLEEGMKKYVAWYKQLHDSTTSTAS